MWERLQQYLILVFHDIHIKISAILCMYLNFLPRTHFHLLVCIQIASRFPQTGLFFQGVLHGTATTDVGKHQLINRDAIFTHTHHCATPATIYRHSNTPVLACSASFNVLTMNGYAKQTNLYTDTFSDHEVQTCL